MSEPTRKPAGPWNNVDDLRLISPRARVVLHLGMLEDDAREVDDDPRSQCWESDVAWNRVEALRRHLDTGTKSAAALGAFCPFGNDGETFCDDCGQWHDDDEIGNA